MKTYIIMFVAALLVCASATAVQDFKGNSSAMTILLKVEEYAQVWFQDDNWASPPSGPDAEEPDIRFSGTQGTDWHNTQLIGAYSSTNSTTGAATEGWARGYFESADGATIWLKCNVDMDATIVCSGDLLAKEHVDTSLPTWFTVAVNGYDEETDSTDPNGFRLGNSGTNDGWVNDGALYGDGRGGYGGMEGQAAELDGNEPSDNGTVPGQIDLGGQPFHGVQTAFKMADSDGKGYTYTMDLNAPVGPGTMKFLARVKRSSVGDVADDYTATITPTFVVTGP